MASCFPKTLPALILQRLLPQLSLFCELGPTSLSSPSANGTYLAINSPSNFSGNLINLQKNGTNEFTLTNGGAITNNGAITAAGNIQSTSGFLYLGSVGDTYIDAGSSGQMNFDVDEYNTGAAYYGYVFGTTNYEQATTGTGGQINTGGLFAGVGSAVWNEENLHPIVIQTAAASGITRGLLVSPTLTSAVDYRSIETQSGLIDNLATGTPVNTVYNVLFNPITYQTASTVVDTIATSSSLDVNGLPLVGKNVKLTNSYGLLVDTDAVNASTTNAYGLEVNSPSGAANNYAAVFNGGNVGIGTTTPGSLLTLQGSAGSATNLLSIASSTGASLLTVTPAGRVNIPTDASSSNTTELLSLGSTALSSASANGTYFGINSQSNFSGNFLTFEDNGVKELSVDSSGDFIYGSGASQSFDATANTANTTNAAFVFKMGASMSAGLRISSGSNLTKNNGSTVNILDIQQPIGPTSGSSQFNTINASPTINQTGGASGVVTGINFNPTLTAVSDYRAINIPALTYTLSAGSAINTNQIAYGSLFNAYTLASSSATTIANASVINITGAAIAGNHMTISSSSALTIQGGSVTNSGAVTNGYGLYVNAPTGASNNYAAVFTGGNVGVGTTTPGSAFVVAANCLTFQSSGACTDYAEIYPSRDPVAAGQLVSSLGTASSTGSLIGETATAYDSHLLGVVSTNPAMIIEGNSVQFMNGANYVVDPLHPAIALAGRVPVQIATSTVIHAGDFLTSSDIPGLAMKAEVSGEVIGQALEDYDPAANTSSNPTILVFVKPGYQVINNTFVFGQNDGQLSSATSTTSFMRLASSSTDTALLINQAGSGNVLQLQQNGADRLLIANDGSFSLLATSTIATSTILTVNNGSTTQFSITAAGHITVGADTAGTAVITAGNNQTAVTFNVPYETMPKIAVTAQGLPNFYYGVATKTLTGFTIQTSQPVSADTSFDWIALAQPTTTPSQSSLNSQIVVVNQPSNQGQIISNSQNNNNQQGGGQTLGSGSAIPDTSGQTVAQPGSGSSTPQSDPNSTGQAASGSSTGSTAGDSSDASGSSGQTGTPVNTSASDPSASSGTASAPDASDNSSPGSSAPGATGQ